MTTQYNRDNAEFSLYVHEYARKEVYPKIWPGCGLQITHLDGTKKDLEDKVDVEVEVSTPGLISPILFRVQERWRKASFSKWRDVTITEFNKASGVPVEFYVGSMDYILYGYFDEAKNIFGDVLLVNIPKLRNLVATSSIEFTTECNNKEQLFKAFKFDSLSVSGAVDWHSGSFIATDDMPRDFYRSLYLREKSKNTM